MDELSCRACGVEISYSGKGRKPSFCDTHRPKKLVTDRKPTSRKNPQRMTDAALRMELSNLIQGFGAVMLAVDPFDGSVIISGSDALVEALMVMANQNPTFRKWLESGSSSMTWVQLAIAVGAIALPIAAHHKIIPMDETQLLNMFHPKLTTAGPVRVTEQVSDDEAPASRGMESA